MNRLEQLQQAERILAFMRLQTWSDGSIKGPNNIEFFNKCLERLQQVVNEVSKV